MVTVEDYDNLVKEAITEVKNGQHLRFIKYYLQTEDVCYYALKYELRHNSKPFDIEFIPVGHLEKIMVRLKNDKDCKISDSVWEYLENVVKERLERSSKPGYYTYITLEECFKMYDAVDMDDYLKKLFIERVVFNAD